MRKGMDRSIIAGIGLLATLMLGIAATSYANTRPSLGQCPPD